MPDEDHLAEWNASGYYVQRGPKVVASAQSQTLAARIAEEHNLVRELAERGPFLDQMGGCDTCTIPNGTNVDTLSVHEPSCLWRRAKALYPDSQP